MSLYFTVKSIFSKRCLSIVLLLIANASFGQDPQFEWVRTAEGPGYSTGSEMVLDSGKYIIYAGVFQNTVDFDPGPGTYNLTANGTNNAQNIFISKVDTAGNFIWAKKIGGVQAEFITGMCADKNGDLCITGLFQGTVDFDPGPGTYTMTSNGSEAFILKLDDNGDFKWAKQIATPHVLAVTINAGNDIFIAGEFDKTVDFDPGPGTFSASPLVLYNTDLWLVKLTAQGDFVWMRQFKGSTNLDSEPTSLRTDKTGNVYMAGYFFGTMDFDPGAGTLPFTAININGFITKLTGNGDLVWARQFAGTDRCVVTDLELDNNENIITSGGFTALSDFDPGAGVYTLSAASNYTNVFISKLDNNGNFIFAKQFTNTTQNINTNGMTLDGSGDIYLTGGYGGYLTNPDFDPGPAVYNIQAGDIYIAKLSNAGDFRSAKGISALNGMYSTIFGTIKTDIFKNIYTVSAYSIISDFDPGPATFNKTPAGSWDAFIHKMRQCKNEITALSASSCGSYTLNGTVYDSSGTYYQAIPLAGGCDSIIQLSLTIQRLRTTVAASICEGEIYETHATAGVFSDTLTSSLGCDSIRVLTLTVHPKPVPVLGADKGICANNNITLSPGSFPSYTWNDGSLAPQLTVKVPGLYWVKVTDAFSCSASDSIVISAGTTPTIVATSSNDITCSNGTAQLSASGAQSYNWSPAAGISNPVQNPVVSPSATTTYTVTGIDANGCAGTASVTVHVAATGSGTLYMASAFTPNRNGINDCYGIKYPGSFRSLQFVIYNRWGEKVFAATNANTCWDGRYKGLEQPAGAYVYYIKAISDCGIIDTKGMINLVR